MKVKVERGITLKEALAARALVRRLRLLRGYRLRCR